MGSFGFSALSMAVLSALIVPLVVLYFLKLKRPRMTIPSLVLWQQVINDSRVNSPFQKFKKSMLLLLQLLALAALILAAMQPYWIGRIDRAERLPILIDCSASMAALDRPGGKSRLDEAKDKAREAIDHMLSDQELCLVSFGRTARRLTGFTNNKQLLRGALDGIRVEEVESNVEDALRLAQAIARTAPFDEVLLLSDGNFPEKTELELSLNINFVRLPQGGQNLGITSLNARRTADGAWDVFVRVEARAAESVSGRVIALRDGVEIGAEPVTLANAETQRLVFRVPGDAAGAMEVRIEPSGFDSLAQDNVAWLNLPALRQLWVYAPTTLESYRHALKAMATVRLFPEDENSTTNRNDFDLVITDRAQDMALPAPSKLLVGLVPPGLENCIAVDQSGTEVVDWRRDAALLVHVQLKDLVLIDSPASAAGVSESDYEALGWEILAEGTRGPLILEKRRADTVTDCLLFHSDRSTLPYRIGFPIMVSNLVQMACQRAGLTEAEALKTGVLPPIALAGASAEYHVSGPQGMETDERTDEGRRLRGIAAPNVGLYTFSRSGTAEEVIGAAVLSSQETALAAAEQILFSENLKVTAAAGAPKMDKPLWPIIALVAFAVLLVEWLYFHRSSAWRTR